MSLFRAVIRDMGWWRYLGAVALSAIAASGAFVVPLIGRAFFDMAGW